MEPLLIPSIDCGDKFILIYLHCQSYSNKYTKPQELFVETIKDMLRKKSTKQFFETEYTSHFSNFNFTQ